MAIFNESLTESLTLSDVAVLLPHTFDKFLSQGLELSDTVGVEQDLDRTIISTLVLTQIIQDFLAQFYEPISQSLSLSDVVVHGGDYTIASSHNLDLSDEVLQVQYLIDTIALSQVVGDSIQLGRDLSQNLVLSDLIVEQLVHPEDQTLIISDIIAAIVVYNRAIVDTCILTDVVSAWIVGAIPECDTERWPETGDPTLEPCP